MKKETIEVLEKNTIEKGKSSCCGGAPSTDKGACCKLDEEKKAEGGSGCGCNADPEKKSSCC